MFITFEGPEGGGKTTQIELLKVRLWDEAGHKSIVTREPGGTPFGENIRTMLKSVAGENAPVPRAELFLFEAARAQHVHQVIAPALAEGVFVLCDRYTDSTMAYQGHARQLNLDMGNGTPSRTCVSSLNNLATDGLYPDVTFLLDVDPAVGLGRSSKRNGKAFDRFDNESLGFHISVREAFLDIAFENRERIFVIDAEKAATKVAEDIWWVVKKKLDKRDGASQA
jgi:dTMP kinase